MIWNKGDIVHINVNNKLQDTTTIHWHGMHLTAVMWTEARISRSLREQYGSHTGR
ncbi:MAG: multicopper oxidase domain-containing protein [Ignavibacteria bacterium]|nr:multicopper oxidase domain-containing protein [Ignavibacteria bacterium]